MNISNVKEHFHQQLGNDYSATEIESMFDLLIEKYSEKDRLIVKPEMELNKVEQNKFEDALARLKKHEPIQYILGEIDFMGRPFKVNENVHVPRQETETMIEWVLEDYKDLKATQHQLSLLDIGTGCGVLPITLAKELPELRVAAVDISEKALDVARENAARNNAKIEFLQDNVLEMENLPGKFDILVSNPPYVLERAKKDVQRKILDYEPPVALYVKDNDPMIFNRKIAELAKKNLSPNGLVYVEINKYLQAETAAVFKENGFKTQFRKDVFGNIRTVKAFREV